MKRALISVSDKTGVVEFARDVLGLPEAASTEEVPDTPDPVIDMMEEQKKISRKGGTMRLGDYDCALREGTLAHRIYGGDLISERHRHRYEFNDRYRRRMEEAGMIVSGQNPDSGLAEIVEIPSHPFFIGTQFHPEFKSTPENPQPVFVNFVAAACRLIP